VYEIDLQQMRKRLKEGAKAALLEGKKTLSHQRVDASLSASSGAVAGAGGGLNMLVSYQDAGAALLRVAENVAKEGLRLVREISENAAAAAAAASSTAAADALVRSPGAAEVAADLAAAGARRGPGSGVGAVSAAALLNELLLLAGSAMSSSSNSSGESNSSGAVTSATFALTVDVNVRGSDAAVVAAALAHRVAGDYDAAARAVERALVEALDGLGAGQ
jgi:hypothetical protein